MMAWMLIWMGRWLIAGMLLVVVISVLVGRSRRSRLEAHWERRRREELEAYCRLDVTLPAHSGQGKLAEAAKRICRVAAEKSVFAKAALFLRTGRGALVCVGSCGMDDLTLAALDRWRERGVREPGEGTEGASLEQRARREPWARRSFSVVLGEPEEFDAMPGRVCHQATIVPLRIEHGRLAGVLAVCSDRDEELRTERMQQAVMPLELLAERLVRSLERDAMTERLADVERLAGAGQIVAGVAHDLNHPLTVILGLAERIAGMASELPVRQDAAAIASHGLQMRESLRGLLSFWRPRVEDDGGRREPGLGGVRPATVRDVA